MAIRWIGGWATPKRQMKILITGGAGFLGTRLTQRFLAEDHEVTVISRDEAKHWKLRQVVDNNPRLHTFVWNAADQRHMNVAGILQSVAPDVVIIAHAMKRIDVCEAQPGKALEINTIAVQQLLEYIVYAKPKNLKNIVLISTDKAANPISAYGTTKLLSEQLIRNAHTTIHNDCKINFVVLRYGNVLDSTGSVIPYIKNRIALKQPLQITDPRMTRFIFTAKEAVDMVMYMISYNKSGLWIPGRIPSMCIGNLFDLYSEKYNVPIERGFPRSFPEKSHEILNTDYEQIQWLPYESSVPLRSLYQKLTVGHTQQVISSKDVQLTKLQLKLLLESENLL